LQVSRKTLWCGVSFLFSFSFLTRAASLQTAPNPNEEPTTILRNAMMAACSQNADDFQKVLTTRNSAAFARITPAAKATFLKRFVLLDQPGQPHSQNTSNETYMVTCANETVTTQIQIGKPEIRDNLAYIPFDIKEASDTSGQTTRHAIIGMVHENGQWKLLSLGLLLLDLPSLEEEWDKAEIAVNEKSAIAYMKEISDAVEAYRKKYTRLPDTLAVMGAPPQGSAKPDKAGLLGEDLSSGRKEGYIFRYVIVGANSSGAPAKYELAAIPAEYGRSGTRSFFRDSNGVLHAADRQGAVGSISDPKIE
jgi:hypothetical protein